MIVEPQASEALAPYTTRVDREHIKDALWIIGLTIQRCPMTKYDWRGQVCPIAVLEPR